VSQGNSEHAANPDSGAYGVLIRAFPTCKFLVLRFRIFMETAVIPLVHVLVGGRFFV
jgi:hypothetical protein